MGVKMNSLMPKKSEILQRFEIDKKTSFFSIKEMALPRSEPLMSDGRRCFMTHVKFSRQTM